MRRWLQPARVLPVVVGAILLTAAEPAAVPRSALAASGCAAAAMPVACENSLPGTPRSRWDLPAGGGSPSIQGFTTRIGVQRGETVSFKVNTVARAYRIELYRIGWYGGNGARLIATVRPSARLPQTQPACRRGSVGLVDCGNWAESARWTVPDDAVSGVFAARLVREDGVFGVNQIVFVVRDDARRSDLLFQTSDATWQAYNMYGGSNLYAGTTTAPAGKAYKVSYNRPLIARNANVVTTDRRNHLFGAEYPMLRWLERNGYDVTYTTGADVARLPGTVAQHDVFLSVGHDEYTSAEQRRAMTQARDAGVHLGFFSGNEVYWKTRWEPSIDGAAAPYRTLVCYKETNLNRKIDPSPLWTGLWRDMRFSPPSDGGPPENALTGTSYGSDKSPDVSLTVPSGYAGLRFWRNTSVARLGAGQSVRYAPGTLGWEWDIDLDNGWRPPGLIRMSETTVTTQHRRDMQVVTGPATHHLTLYRAPSGALVFGAGTIQWSWGLDSVHDRASAAGTAHRDIQQATVNLFADMGVQPFTLQADLIRASRSADDVAPVAAFDPPVENLPLGRTVTLTGSATDAGGVPAAVEVSTDGGSTWHPPAGAARWRYDWTPRQPGTTLLLARATDDSANLQRSPTAVVVSVS